MKLSKLAKKPVLHWLMIAGLTALLSACGGGGGGGGSGTSAANSNASCGSDCSLPTAVSSVPPQ